MILGQANSIKLQYGHGGYSCIIFFVNTIAKTFSAKERKWEIKCFYANSQIAKLYSCNSSTTQPATDGGGTGGNLVLKE